LTTREGSLEAPTRHPIDWKNPEYWQEPKIVAEMGRIFDICHGCRRCVSLCNTFPTLFDLIDEGPTGELDGVPKEKYWDVVDQCYLCDLCYMVKCPYVPPHPWNVDFPHIMLRAKAYEFREGRMKHPVRDRLLSSTDRNGKLATIPVVVQAVNAGSRSKPLRALGEKIVGVHKDAWVPQFAPRKFRPNAQASRSHAVRDGALSPGRVAIFATCYVNYNEPGIGHDLLKILDHNEVPYVLLDKESCCGMPKLEQGDLDHAWEWATEGMRLYAEAGDPTGIAMHLDDLGELALLDGDPTFALRLAGAAEGVREKIAGGAPPTLVQNTDYVANARSALPGPGAEAAWAAGRALDRDAAIAEALESRRRPSGPSEAG